MVGHLEGVSRQKSQLGEAATEFQMAATFWHRQSKRSLGCQRGGTKIGQPRTPSNSQQSPAPWSVPALPRHPSTPRQRIAATQPIRSGLHDGAEMGQSLASTPRRPTPAQAATNIVCHAESATMIFYTSFYSIK